MDLGSTAPVVAPRDRQGLRESDMSRQEVVSSHGRRATPNLGREVPASDRGRDVAWIPSQSCGCLGASPTHQMASSSWDEIVLLDGEISYAASKHSGEANNIRDDAVDYTTVLGNMPPDELNDLEASGLHGRSHEQSHEDIIRTPVGCEVRRSPVLV